MRVGVDLAAEHLLGAGHGDARDLTAQLFASAIELDADLGATRFDLRFASGFAVGLPLLDDARGARVRLIDDAARLVASGRDDLVDLDFGRR